MVDEIKKIDDTNADNTDDKKDVSTVDIFKNVIKKLDGCVISLNSNVKSAWDDSLRSGISLNVYQQTQQSFPFGK